MPKILGFAIILFCAYNLIVTMHETITMFSKHGAGETEISLAIATILAVGAITVATFNMLWM